MRYYALTPRPWIGDDGGYWSLPDGSIGAVDLAPVGGQSYVFATFAEAPKGVEAAIGDGTRLGEYHPSASERASWAALIGIEIPAGVTLLDALWETLTASADPDGELRAKPIMPTHRGDLELHLGGHSLIRSERLPADPSQHPAWPAIQRVLQRQYRDLHDGQPAPMAARGRMTASRSGDPVLARKWLGAMQRKYRMQPEQARDLLIPAGLPREMPLTPTTTISDDFNRPDGPIGSSAEGWSWAEVIGGYDVAANAVTQTGINAGNAARAEIALSSDDHRCSLTLLDVPSSSITGGGPTVRCDPTANYWYEAIIRNDSRGIRRRVAGGISVVASATGGHDPSDQAYLEADGSTLTLVVGDAAPLVITDTAISGNLRCGMYCYADASFFQPYDDWSAADLLAPPVEITGTLSATEGGPDTVAVAGGADVDGDVDATEPGPDTATATGSVTVSGSVTISEAGPDTAAATGTTPTTGGMAATESGSDTVRISGTAPVEVAGTLAAVEGGPDTAALTGDVPVTGDMAATEAGSDTASFTITIGGGDGPAMFEARGTWRTRTVRGQWKVRTARGAWKST